MTTTKTSISYDEDLDEAIEMLVERGYYDSRSDFFREAAAFHIGEMFEQANRVGQLTKFSENDVDIIATDYEQAAEVMFDVSPE